MQELSKSWWKSAAEEAEIELSASDSDEEVDGPASMAKAASANAVRAKEAELAAMLSVPVGVAGYGGKYPTKTGRLVLAPMAKGETKSGMQSLNPLHNQL